MRTVNFSMLVMLSVFIMAAVAVGNSPVAAEPCTIQPSSLAFTAQQYNYYTNGVIVPVSVTCSFVGGQLSAVGDAMDASTNARVGHSVVALSSAPGTNIYAGQLVFSIPLEVTGRTLQISISVYGGVYGLYTNAPYSNGSPLTTSVETVQVNANSYYYNYGNCYYNNNCGFNSPGNYGMNNNNMLKCSLSNGNQVQCVGYLYQDPNSCVILVIPVYSSVGVVSYQYYTLQQLPSSYPGIGTWVSVTGQLNQGNNFSSTGASCPGNYINIASISS